MAKSSFSRSTYASTFQNLYVSTPCFSHVYFFILRKPILHRSRIAYTFVYYNRAVGFTPISLRNESYQVPLSLLYPRLATTQLIIRVSYFMRILYVESFFFEIRVRTRVFVFFFRRHFFIPSSHFIKYFTRQKEKSLPGFRRYSNLCVREHFF